MFSRFAAARGDLGDEIDQHADRAHRHGGIGYLRPRRLRQEGARTETAEPSLRISDIANLANLVADIAVRGSRRTAIKTGGQDG